MKRKVLFVASLFLATATFAQDGLTSKKGFKYLPEAGDYSIGTNADPFIKFTQNILNFANNTGVKVDGFNNAGSTDYVSGFNQVIVGKYFLTDKQAVRVAFGINTERSITKTFGDNPVTPNAAPNSDVIQLTKVATGKYDWFMSAGMEYRRGHNRLQGFYGYEVALGFSNSGKTANTYGVEYNQTAQDSSAILATDSRVLKTKAPLNVRLGLRGFVGVEYFFMPKMSVGAEFGWGFAYIKDFGKGRTVTEHWGIKPGSGATTNSAYETDVEGTTQTRSTGFQVDQGTGSMLNQASSTIKLNFHF
jgi:hypothetical protein